jgi:hypothetical protein
MVYPSVIYRIVRLNIHAPTFFGDFLIDRFVQSELLYLNPNNVPRNLNNPRYFPHTSSINKWYARQIREPNYKINTYTVVQPRDLTITGTGTWQARLITVYQLQQIATAGHQNGEICVVEDDAQVGLLHKWLIDKAVKSRKRQKISATRYIAESFNRVLSPYLRKEYSHFLSSYWVHTDTTNHFMNA